MNLVSDFVITVEMIRTKISGVANPGAASDIYPVLCPIPPDSVLLVGTLEVVATPIAEIA